MTDRHKDERLGYQPEPFYKNANHNVVDFATSRDHRKDLADDELEGMGKCRMLKALQQRSERFGSGLFPLHGDNLLMSMPGGFSFVVPDLSAAHRLLRQWEGRA
jgi:hypothetical protein